LAVPVAGGVDLVDPPGGGVQQGSKRPRRVPQFIPAGPLPRNPGGRAAASGPRGLPRAIARRGTAGNAPHPAPGPPHPSGRGTGGAGPAGGGRGAGARPSVRPPPAPPTAPAPPAAPPPGGGARVPPPGANPAARPPPRGPPPPAAPPPRPRPASLAM